MSSLDFAAMLLSGAIAAGDLDAQDAQCRVIHYAADGARRETAPSRPYAGPPHTVASTSSSRGGSAQSAASVSASASSSGAGSAVVRAVRDGRAITKTYDNEGCTIVIDDRPPAGARR